VSSAGIGLHASSPGNGAAAPSRCLACSPSGSGSRPPALLLLDENGSSGWFADRSGLRRSFVALVADALRGSWALQERRALAALPAAVKGSPNVLLLVLDTVAALRPEPVRVPSTQHAPPRRVGPSRSPVRSSVVHGALDFAVARFDPDRPLGRMSSAPTGSSRSMQPTRPSPKSWAPMGMQAPDLWPTPIAVGSLG
jgi:hypothetical protein